MKTIASLEIAQTGELLERLKEHAIPVQVNTATEEHGLEISVISVEDSYYERGCDVVEAWFAEQVEQQKKRSRVYCRRCGSRNYDTAWDERIGYIYKCRNCGEEFSQ
jgi:hypothetical protein